MLRQSRKLLRQSGALLGRMAHSSSAATTTAAAATTTTTSIVNTASAIVTVALPLRRNQKQLDNVDGQEWRGGPQTLEQLQLRVIAKTPHFLVINKGHDERLDGNFEVTVEKALYRDFPEVEKFRWIHQLDFATSGLLCIGLEKAATSLACRLFREKRVQKEYLALVRGHLPFHPRDLATNTSRSVKTCTLSKLELLIQDTEQFDFFRTQQRGSKRHQKQRSYPRGPRQGSALFHMEQAKIIREKQQQNEELTPQEREFTTLKWHDVSTEEQKRYHELAKIDKTRFLKELNVFLEEEKIKLAKKRKYEAIDERSDDDSQSKTEETKRAEEEEPVAYIFDYPIVEPKGEVFQMQIADQTSETAVMEGKPSTTIAFVLGHAMYQQEPVTKVLLRPLSGRRHQLRLHLAHTGFPIVGDVTYGSQADMASRMMLHAWKLWLMAPPDAQKQYGDLFFTSPDPFADLVPSQREISTITYQHQERELQTPASSS